MQGRMRHRAAWGAGLHGVQGRMGCRAAWGAGPHGGQGCMGCRAIEEGERPHGLVEEGRGRPKGLAKEDGGRVSHFGGHNSSSRARRRGRQEAGEKGGERRGRGRELITLSPHPIRATSTTPSSPPAGQPLQPHRA